VDAVSIYLIYRRRISTLPSVALGAPGVTGRPVRMWRWYRHLSAYGTPQLLCPTFMQQSPE
jgi:hypothetical protein